MWRGEISRWDAASSGVRRLPLRPTPSQPAATQSIVFVASLSSAALLEALCRHIDGLADNLTAHNVADYLDLPEHVGVAAVRRLRSSNGRLAALVAEER